MFFNFWMFDHQILTNIRSISILSMPSYNHVYLEKKNLKNFTSLLPSARHNKVTIQMQRNADNVLIYLVQCLFNFGTTGRLGINSLKYVPRNNLGYALKNTWNTAKPTRCLTTWYIVFQISVGLLVTRCLFVTDCRKALNQGTWAET